MLGRRKSCSAPDAIDITDRVRRRVVGSDLLDGQDPANGGNRFAQPRGRQSTSRRSGTGSATLLSFADTPVYRVLAAQSVTLEDLYQALALLTDRLEIDDTESATRSELAIRVGGLLEEILNDLELSLSLREQSELVKRLVDELNGLGPLEILLADDTVSDITINGADRVYVERRGRLQLTDVRFRSGLHVMRIARRIVRRVGRRLDESQPMVDARLSDGSRVNMIIPPLAVDGPMITIRKFAAQEITLDGMVKQGNLSADMATVLRVATRCRLNILISGGSGSGKTALLNAMSEMIDPADRVVTIEDVAELQLHQPHVVRLETQPFGLRGEVTVTERELLRNALRMRPDRIIVGEVRGGEAVDMLQAMNCGQDGSLSTIHATRPRGALTRMENLLCLAGLDLTPRGGRVQIAHAIDLIVHLERMRDGLRRVTHITEVLGIEKDTIVTRDLFTFEASGMDETGRVLGSFEASGVTPSFVERAALLDLGGTLRKPL